MKLIVASNNQGKIAEIKAIAAPFFDEIVSQKDAGIVSVPEETGDTFFDNALIKAKEIFAIAGHPVIADDSGLIVDALDGAPGVFSARYAGGKGDAANNMLLLKNMQGKTDRRARFCSCVVLYISEQEYYTGVGTVEGEILHAERGTGGFGYDPLFFCNELNKGFGEATPEEKNAVSHRFRALTQAIAKFKSR